MRAGPVTLAALVVLVVPPGCTGSPPGSTTGSPPGSTAGAPAGPVETGRDPCGFVVSSIGYAGALLPAAGARLGDAARSRVSAVRGAILEVRDRLPTADVRRHAQDVLDAALVAAAFDTGDAERAAALRDYRAAAAALVAACEAAQG